MNNLSIAKRITLFTVVALVFTCAIIGVFAYNLQKNEVISANAARALAVARTVSSALDADEFVNLMQTLEQNDYYKDYNSFLNETMDKCDILYLYVIGSNYDTDVVYFAEGFPSEGRVDEEQIFLGDTEAVEVYAGEMFETIHTGKETTTSIYNLGGFGEMVSAFSPVTDDSGNIIGVVGVDLSVDGAIVTANRFGLAMIAIIAVICLLVTILIAFIVRTYIGRPIHELETAADRLAQGHSDVTIVKRRDDEIGHLAAAFIRIIESGNEQSALIERLADGDLTVDVRPRCADDTVNNSLAKMVHDLNTIMIDISSGVNQVSISSNQIAVGSQSVAQGSAEQAASIEQLSAGIQTLLESLSHNAAVAEKAALLSEQAKVGAKQGGEQMEQMLLAVKEITEASTSIEKVMKVIDDIAFQTNILALNAAVEAARAGVHGKGFAVVAEEVRNLAAKSAEAARNSESLILNSMEKSAFGAKIAGETSESLYGIVESINQSTELVSEIARAGNSQVDSVGEISKAVEQVSGVVQENSAAAQESAAASQEMNSQSNLLNSLVARFKLK